MGADMDAPIFGTVFKPKPEDEASSNPDANSIANRNQFLINTQQFRTGFLGLNLDSNGGKLSGNY